jgi:autophagy-related protein 9
VQFFTRVYDYHQKGGFTAMAVGDVCELLQFIFIVFMSTFLLQCVNYPVLFRDKPADGHNATDKRTFRVSGYDT